MSTLKADTIQNTSGGAVTLTNQHAAKAYVMFVGGSLTGDSDLTGVNDSLNLSSVVDNSAGDYTFTLSNGMSSVNYATVTGRQQNNSNFGAHADIKYNTSPTPAQVRMQYVEHYAIQDTPRGSIAWLGDLA